MVAHNNSDGCGHGDGEEGADDAGQGRADGDGEQDNGRVQAHGLGLQHRLEDIAFHLLDDDDKCERQQRVGQAIGDQRDDDGEGASGDRTDDRDEAGEERHHGDDERKRNLQNPQAKANEDCVHHGHGGLRLDEAGQGLPDAGTEFSDVPAGGIAGVLAQPRQELVAVFNDEEGDKEHDQRGHDDGAGHRETRDNAGGDGGGLALGKLDHVLEHGL